jgi:acetyl esterase/lipase
MLSKQWPTHVSAAVVALVGWFLISTCCPARGQEINRPDKTAALARVEKDVPYAPGGDQHMLDLYLPARKRFRTVVFTYGGGWHTGSRKSVQRIGEKFQGLGYGCALLSHRLAPKDRFPAQAEDVAAAFAWVKKNIEAKGGDPLRVVLMGHSSGAHLSLLVATDPKYLARHKLSPADIAGVVGLSTPVDLEPHKDRKGFGDALMAGRGADVFSRDAAVMKAASPIRHVSKDLPPTLLIVGEKDFPMLQGDARRFALAANGKGRKVTTFVAAGCDHMGVVRSLLADRSAVREQVLAFLQRLGDKAK